MPPPDKTGPTGATGATGATGPAGVGAAGAAGDCYMIWGWRPGSQPEGRGPFNTLAGAQAAFLTMNANPNVVIIGPLPVAEIMQGSLNP